MKSVVTGGSRGLGLGIVETLASKDAEVTVVARNQEHLAEVRKQLGVNTIAGDATDGKLANNVLSTVRPSILILSASAVLTMGKIQDLS